MAKDEEKPSEVLSSVASQTMEQARGAMENYLNLLQKGMSGAPWMGTELNKKMADYAKQNIDGVFEFAQKLTKGKDLQDLVRIQTEFFQTQLNSLTEQAKDLGETVTKVAAGALKGPSS